MCSNALNRRLAFSFIVIILAYNFLSFITKALEYIAIVKFKNIFMHCFAFLSDEFLFTSLLLMS